MPPVGEGDPGDRDDGGEGQQQGPYARPSARVGEGGRTQGDEHHGPGPGPANGRSGGPQDPREPPPKARAPLGGAAGARSGTGPAAGPVRSRAAEAVVPAGAGSRTAVRTASRTSASACPAAPARTVCETRAAHGPQRSRCFSSDQASVSGREPSA